VIDMNGKSKKAKSITTEKKDKLLKEIAKDHANAQEEKKEKLRKSERELMLLSLARDVGNVRAMFAEASAYAQTFNKLDEEEKHNKVQDSGYVAYVDCEDGVRRNKEYYQEKYYQFHWTSQYMQVGLNRTLIEQGVSLDELNEFMKKRMQQ